MSTSMEAAANEPLAGRAQRDPGTGLRAHLIALGGYFALALLVTYPLVLHFATRVPGDLLADRDQNLWNLWWVKEALFQPTNPFHTNIIFYPYGVDLYYHTLGLPLGLIGLIPLVLLGLPAAYNTVVLVAFTLGGYGAFRLCLYITSRTEKEDPSGSQTMRIWACFLGGVVFAFTPYMLYALEGTTEVLSVQWIPFYAEFWLRAWYVGRWRDAVLAGIFLALAAYTSLYYAAYLLLFTVVFMVYSLIRTRPESREGAGMSTGVLALVVAGALVLPLAGGLLTDYNNPRFAVSGKEQQIEHSADLLGLISLPYDHPLVTSLGGGGFDEKGNLPSRSYLTLGYVALALAVLGAIRAWKRPDTPFWVLLAGICLVLALGPQLQVGQTVTSVPLPFKLLAWLPGVEAIGKVERFVVMVRLGMAVLAAWGAIYVLSRLGRVLRARGLMRVALPAATVLALLLVELPIHPRLVQPLNIPQGFDKLAQHSDGAGLMELPVTINQDQVVGERMLFQTTHGHPIMGAYLSRAYTSPIMDSCGPFWSFISARYLPIEGRDIVTPTMESRPLDILNFYNLKYIAVYSGFGGADTASKSPLDPVDRKAYEDILAHVSHGAPLYKDDYVDLRQVDPVSRESMVPSLLTANGWYDLEGGGTPFRWVKGGTARLCVFSPRTSDMNLVLEGTAFGHSRDVEITSPATPDKIYRSRLPAGGQFARLTVSLHLQEGMTEVVISSPGEATTPSSLDPKTRDNRPLTVGLRNVHLEGGGG